MRYAKEFYFLVQELFEKSAEEIAKINLWEGLKFINGLDEMNECIKNTYTDDGTPSILLPFIRATDTIIVNGKVKLS